MKTAPNENPYLDPLSNFFRRLLGLKGFYKEQINHLQYDLENFRKTKGASINKSKPIYLIFHDISNISNDKFGVGKFEVEKKNYQITVNQLIKRSSDFTIAQSFETFETFVKDIFAFYYLNNQTKASPKCKSKYDETIDIILKFTEYGFMIFKNLSDAFGCRTDYFNKI